VRVAAVSRWAAAGVVVAGDIFTDVGGKDGGNISAFNYKLHVSRARTILGCDTLPCHVAPGNHDLEVDIYQQRWLDAFGTSDTFGSIGNISFYAINGMTRSSGHRPTGNVDVLLNHYPSSVTWLPMRMRYPAMNPSYIFSGHEHAYRKTTNNLTGVAIPEFTLPSFNYITGRGDGDQTMGFGVVTKGIGMLDATVCRSSVRGTMLVLYALLTLLVSVLTAASAVYLEYPYSNAISRGSSKPDLDKFVVNFSSFWKWMAVYLSELFATLYFGSLCFGVLVNVLTWLICAGTGKKIFQWRASWLRKWMKRRVTVFPGQKSDRRFRRGALKTAHPLQHASFISYHDSVLGCVDGTMAKPTELSALFEAGPAVQL